MQLSHEDHPHTRVLEQRAHGEAEAEPSDQHVAGALLEHHLGQSPLGGRLDIVHDEDAVHPQLECAVVAAPYDDLVIVHGYSPRLARARSMSSASAGSW
jgi:hypothetical protein